MAHVQANIVEFYSKLEEYRANEKYADVTIKCEEKIFKCHRVILAVACNFFDTMFSSQFKESGDHEITLPETKAETFKEVVQFIYTGDVSITSSNVNSLLEASEFFGLPGISDLCTKFIETHKIGALKTLSAFLFACRTKKQVLIDQLSKDIVEHFKVISRADEFLDIPFEELRTILSQWSSPNTEEVKIGAIVRWVSHDQRRRIQHIYDLVEMIRFGNITSAEYIRVVFAKLWAEPHDIGSLTESLKPAGFNDIAETSREADLEKNSLCVYVRGTVDNSLRVFSSKDGINFTVTPAKNLLNSSPYQWIRSISMGNHLYRLDYCRRGPDAEPSEQAFTAHTSANMMGPSLSLMPPPLAFGDVSFCALGNNIYAYHKTIFRQLIRTSCKNLTPFDDEEINRGVYVYNCELDNWFPVPAMRKQLQESCMIGWNDQILYLIDGVDNQQTPLKYVQAYDCRVGTWQKMPTSKTNVNFAGGDGCVYGNKIYVCGGGMGAGHHHAGFEIFDPAARYWETSNYEQRMYSAMKYHKVVPHRYDLWVIGSLSGGVNVDNLSSVQRCSFTWSEPRQGQRTTHMSWMGSNSLINAANGNPGIIMDAVIF